MEEERPPLESVDPAGEVAFCGEDEIKRLRKVKGRRTTTEASAAALEGVIIY